MLMQVNTLIYLTPNNLKTLFAHHIVNTMKQLCRIVFIITIIHIHRVHLFIHNSQVHPILFHIKFKEDGVTIRILRFTKISVLIQRSKFLKLQ